MACLVTANKIMEKAKYKQVNIRDSWISPFLIPAAKYEVSCVYSYLNIKKLINKK